MTKGAIKAIAIGASALLIGATVAAGVGSAKGGKPFQNPHIETWFNNWGKHQEDNPTENPTTNAPTTQAHTWGGVIDDVGNAMNETETTYAMPAALAFYSTTAPVLESKLAAPSVTVTCSHNFEFNNVLVDWSVEYPNGESAADIVNVTPTSDGSLTATLTCSGAFSEPLTLKATLRGNEEKTATCRIDYVKRLQSFKDVYINFNDFEDDCEIQVNPVFGQGTVSGDLKISHISFSLLETFQIGVKHALKFDIDFKSYEMNDILLDSNYIGDNGEDWAYSMFIENFDNYDQAHKNAIYYAWNSVFSHRFNNKNIMSLNVDIALLYNGRTISLVSETDYISRTGSYLTGAYYGEDLSPDLTLNGNFAL